MNYLQRRPITAYFVIAYLFSWAIGGLLIADFYGLITVPHEIYYLMAFGPMLSALAVTGVTDGRAGLHELARRILFFRVGARWWVVAVGMPLMLGGVAIAVHWRTQGTLPDLALLGEVDYLGQIGFVGALGLWTATYGFGEEIGWRGFALHRMATPQRWIQPAVRIGALWGLWHLPYFFFKPNFVALGVTGFFFFVLSITLGSIFLSWLYWSSKRSILIVAVWHALFDFVSASAIAEGAGNMVMNGIIIGTVIVILILQARRPAVD